MPRPLALLFLMPSRLGRGRFLVERRKTLARCLNLPGYAGARFWAARY
ncbi:MAG: hypothetical protein R3C44_19310 [Chloroflexota bacterium]